MRRGYQGRDLITAPASRAVAVTPSDTVDLVDGPTKAVFVGGAGALKVTMLDGDECTFGAVPAGTTVPIQAKRIWSTGTGATSIVALY